MLWRPPVIPCLLLLAGPAAAQAVAPAPVLQAVGVVVAAAPGRSVAVLRSGGRTRVVLLGETAFGARVTAVAPDRVTVEQDGATRELRLAGPLGPAVPFASAAPAAPATAAAPAAREMDRAELQRRITAEAPRILAETSLLPVWDAGQVAGFTITRVPEGTVLAEAGLQPGDVLTHVNDVPIDSLATLVGLWPRLQGSGAVQASLLRGGQPLQLRITLK